MQKRKDLLPFLAASEKFRLMSATVLLALLAGSGFKDAKYPLDKSVTPVVKSIYPIENVGVVARSVTFPSVLIQGQGIINSKYPNASILCLDVANYSGLVTGLIWSMDRELVEEYGLQYIIDRASRTYLTCLVMFMPLARIRDNDNIKMPVANHDAATALSPEIEEKTPAVSIEDVKKAVVAQIEKIQEIVRFAQTVTSKQHE